MWCRETGCGFESRALRFELRTVRNAVKPIRIGLYGIGVSWQGWLAGRIVPTDRGTRQHGRTIGNRLESKTSIMMRSIGSDAASRRYRAGPLRVYQLGNHSHRPSRSCDRPLPTESMQKIDACLAVSLDLAGKSVQRGQRTERTHDSSHAFPEFMAAGIHRMEYGPPSDQSADQSSIQSPSASRKQTIPAESANSGGNLLAYSAV